MKYLISFIFLMLLSSQIKSQGLEAYINYGIFDVPADKPYVETYLAITGRSVKWKKVGNALKSNVEVTLVLMRDTDIVSYSKEIIRQQTDNDSTAAVINLVYERRLQAVNGKGGYILKMKLHDLNDTLKPYYSGMAIEVEYPSDSTSISSVMAVKSYSKAATVTKLTKSGYDLVPEVFNFFPSGKNKFTFYAEVYPKVNLKAGDPFLLVYYIKNHESNRIINKYKSYKRMTAAMVNPVLSTFDISGLYTGNFDFVMEVRTAENRLIASRSYFFQRENKNVKMGLSDIASVNISKSFAERINNFDTISLIINSMAPITSQVERQFAESLIAAGNIYPLQQYLLNFWEQRNPDNPEEPFKEYMDEVSKVEKLYSTVIEHGFETDRGRVYLQYGPPNTIVKNYNEPSAYPYEIWHYYKLNSQSNRKFVFYNPSLSRNTFELLHSDAIGESNDYQWRIHLRGRDSGWQSVDQTGESENDWGSKYNEWYKEPR